MFTRRELAKTLVRASVAASLPEGAVRQATASSQHGVGFPVSDYTPFGYLDNPYHTWDVNRSGVIRSVPAIGFGIYYPAGPGGYFDYHQNGIYEALLRLGFFIGEGRFYEPQDFEPGQLTASHHTKNLLRYEFQSDGIRVSATFLQVHEDAIGVRVDLQGIGSSQALKLFATQTYKLGGATWWGRDGLAGQYDRSADAVSIRSFAAGPVFTLTGNRSSASHSIAETELELESSFRKSAHPAQKVSYYPNPLHGALLYEVAIKSGSTAAIKIVLARAANLTASIKLAGSAMAEIASHATRKKAEDDVFWSDAPQLDGDWPAHWKHGWVYDFETLRMMVRRPIGIYKHAWDAMQIQAPRNVLAETSIDMWALSYADPETAKAVFLGQFLDAIEDNIPCMRESGVMNMVSADGSECGTSISWCFPFFCAASIYDRTHDVVWLKKVYPKLASLLRWTLANRRDGDGFLVGKCSWETGMDASKRFLIEQPTGGELTDFIRLVELQAAASHAGSLLARFAPVVRDTASVPEWEGIHRNFAEKTQQLWSENWFYDFDGRSGKLVTRVGRDPAQSAPAFCGVATAEQRRAMIQTLSDFYQHSKSRGKQPTSGWDDGLAWSSLMMPYLESIWATGESDLAADVTTTVAERIYASMDRRTVERESGTPAKPNLGWPGVSCEIWGAHGAFGGEGYGWGAVMPAHIIRNIMGFRETETPEQIWISPNLSALLSVPGKRYSVEGLHYGNDRLSLTFTIIEADRVRVTGRWWRGIESANVSPSAEAKNWISNGRSWQFEAVNHRRYLLRLRNVTPNSIA